MISISGLGRLDANGGGAGGQRARRHLPQEDEQYAAVGLNAIASTDFYNAKHDTRRHTDQKLFS